MSNAMQRFGKVAVLMGGISAERNVSLRSGEAVLNALCAAGVDAHGVDANPENIGFLKSQHFDRAFVMLHGRWGEDGVVQGALTSVGLPFTGSGVLGCALAMDKVRSKQIWRAQGLPTADFKVLRSEQDLDGLIEKLGLPLFLKPAREGSSVGIGKVNHQPELLEVYRQAAESGDDVLAEQFISGAELTVGILNNKALPTIRMQTPNEFYDYEAKYRSTETQYFCPAGLSDELEAQVRDLAEQAFATVDCDFWGRVDIMLDAEQQPMLLEVNPIPGMTDHSLVPMAAAANDIDFQQLVVTILESTL